MIFDLTFRYINVYLFYGNLHSLKSRFKTQESRFNKRGMPHNARKISFQRYPAPNLFLHFFEEINRFKCFPVLYFKGPSVINETVQSELSPFEMNEFAEIDGDN